MKVNMIVDIKYLPEFERRAKKWQKSIGLLLKIMISSWVL